MKNLKRILSVMQILIIIFIVVVNCYNKTTFAQVTSSENQAPLRISIFLYDFKDRYISLVRESFEKIQMDNPGKIEFTFYNGMNDQSIQNKDIRTVLNSKNTNLILLNIVDTSNSRSVIDRIKETGIPVILFNREPLNLEDVKSYNKAFFVGTNSAEAGILQGQILINKWNSDKSTDTNSDNIMEYIMLIGELNNIDATERTKYSVLTIDNAGIRTQELAQRVANWNRDSARDIIESLFLQYGTNIECIISNNDEMAIGAIEALQKYGYNKGDGTKTIAVVGVDGLPEAQELIKQGIMTGSVLQDAQAVAEATYKMGINLVEEKNPLDGLPYVFDSTGIAIRLPYKEIIS